MGKAKQEASARADELLKSYNVKLNPVAGTYRLTDKATGKETNVERSGVDVGTSIFAKGRRANRLIGKELVRRSGTVATPAVEIDDTKSSKPTTQTSTAIPPVSLRSLPKTQFSTSRFDSNRFNLGQGTVVPSVGTSQQSTTVSSNPLVDYSPKPYSSKIASISPIPTKEQIRQGIINNQTGTPSIQTAGVSNNSAEDDELFNQFLSTKYASLPEWRRAKVSQDEFARINNYSKTSSDFQLYKNRVNRQKTSLATQGGPSDTRMKTIFFLKNLLYNPLTLQYPI